jgi:4-alpha-glucanotransferase
MFTKRSTGILLHPSSLPSHGGIGDFGPAAYEFVHWLEEGKQTLWQILPLGPPGIGNSPYSSTSAFAGNILLISLERLADRGLLDRNALVGLPDGGESRVDFEAVRRAKTPLLRQAAERFLQSASGTSRDRFDRFCRDNAWWLDDFVLFDALRERYNGASWNTWPNEIAHRQPQALDQVRNELGHELAVAKFLQFAFFEQWGALRRYCQDRSVQIVGDVAIFVSYDSADVWTHREIFRLRDVEPEVVAGVPPDAFSETGQRWGNPLYNWDRLRERGYDWWVQRMRWAHQLCDILRIDHFRGFESYWEIPAHEPTAIHGHWAKGPADDLFQALHRELGELPFIAEDLGMITPEVHAFRQRLKIPGMRVLQFAFGDRGAHMYLPHCYEPNTVVYTGTHDNDTTMGWWKSLAQPHEKRAAAATLGADDKNVHWAFIRAAQGSVATLCVVPLQDVFGLDSSARMNTPSLSNGNWGWRYQNGLLTKESARLLAEIAETTDRDELLRNSGGNQQRHGERSEDFAA